MNEDRWSRFERLAAQAADEPAPACDVVERVAATLRAVPARPSTGATLEWSVGIAVGLAACVAAFALFHESADDAALALARPAQSVLR